MLYQNGRVVKALDLRSNGFISSWVRIPLLVQKVLLLASLVAQLVKNPPAMQETPVRFLGQEDLLEKEQATHSSVLGLPLWLRW